MQSIETVVDTVHTRLKMADVHDRLKELRDGRAVLKGIVDMRFDDGYRPMHDRTKCHPCDRTVSRADLDRLNRSSQLILPQGVSVWLKRGVLIQKRRPR
jgi:hypothetical protein